MSSAMKRRKDKKIGGKGSELFLIIDEETLHMPNLLDMLWVTGMGKEFRLVE